MPPATDKWIVTPLFFECPEPALSSIAPPGFIINEISIESRRPEDLARVHRPIRDFVAREKAAGNRPVSLAGDCAACIPVLAGLQAAGVHPTLVWIDAHGDFNTPETSPSQFLGGMPLAMITGRGPQQICRNVALAVIPDENVILVDARDLDPLEAQAVRESKLHHISLGQLNDMALLGPVHLHIDVDVIDSDECKAFAFPVKGGPSSEELAGALRDLALSVDLCSVSISGWTGSLDPTRGTAKAVARILTRLLGTDGSARRLS